MGDTWTQTFDFTISSGGWTPTPMDFGTVAGEWTLGVGWEDTQFIIALYNAYYRGLSIDKSLSSSTITSIDVFLSTVLGHNDSHGSPGLWISVNGAIVAVLGWNAIPTESNWHFTWSGLEEAVTSLQVFVGASGVVGGPYNGGSATVMSVVITGIGENPFVSAVGCEACQLGVYAGLDVEEI